MPTWLLLVVISLVALLSILDVVLDLAEGAHVFHLAVEIALSLAALLALTGLTRQYLAERRRAERQRVEREAAQRASREWRREAERWRDEADEILAGLGTMIDTQFERWELTPAEREVALLLLKGLAHKEVAQVRDTSERTARQQARSVYAKAGLGGRAELSAFFLEDLLLPRDTGDGESRATRGRAASTGG